MKRVYLDHNASAPERPEVTALRAELRERLEGNPSSLHARGRAARMCIDEARERTAAALGVSEDEIVFTSGGTESNNLAILGAARAARRRGDPWGVVTTQIEHSAVLASVEQLEREGAEVVRVAPDADGCVAPAALYEAASRVPCGLVSAMAVNNELGTRLDLAGLSERLDGLTHRPILHTDAVQALGKTPLAPAAWGVDLASIAAHKVGGPLGVGALVRRGGVELEPLMYGGGQESGLRPGTEDAAALGAAALAFELAAREQVELSARLAALEAALWDGLRSAFPEVRLLGPALGDDARQPGTLNVLLPNVDGKVLVTRLDLAGLEVSAGSACASGSLEPSHVLRAVGCDDEEARSGLRLSLGRCTTEEDVRQAVDILRKTLG